MPVMDWRAATRAIRSGGGLSARTPIVALTANALLQEQEAFLSDGMNAILTKPLSRDALETVVQQWANAVPTDRTTISEDHLKELHETVGDEVFRNLIDRFVAEIDALSEWLEGAERQDRHEIEARAHKAAGSAASFGATDLRATLIELETTARADESVQLSKACDALRATWMVTRGELISAQPR